MKFCFPPPPLLTDTYEIYFKTLYGSDKKFQDTLTQNENIKYGFFFFSPASPPPPDIEGYEKKKYIITTLKQIL